MTTSPPKYRLWHSSRGITFSPSPESRAPDVPRSHPFSISAPALASAQSDEDGQLEGFGDVQVTYPTLPIGDDVLAEPSKEATVEDNTYGTSILEGDQETASDPLETSTDPPVTALDWKVSDALFRAAQQATPGTPESFWSYTLYRGPGEDGSEQRVKVHYCKSKHTTERVCQQYFMNEKVIGFDLEWVAESSRTAGVKRNVSLIQIASPSRIALFHVALFAKDDDYVAPSFKAIMEDPEITKVGVWIKGDATRIRTHMNIQSRGLMELSHIYKLVKYSQSGQFKNINKRLIPLATQVEQCLGLPMFKGQDVRSSDWSQPLRMEQIIYSASDAYAGVQLYAALEHAREQLRPCPPTPHHAELNLPIRIADGIDLETDSEEELAEQPEEDVPSGGVPSSAARKQRLRACLKLMKETTILIKESLSSGNAIIKEAEAVLQAPQNPRIAAANAWASAFKAENQATQTIQADLRAYHIWHANKEMGVEDVAKELRDPPLKTTTVANYISRAVWLEKLPVDKARYDADIKPFVRYNMRGS